VELPPEDIARAIKYREKVAGILKKSGYRFAALDLEGYRMGSLNPQK
jgi:PP-loop superfamily ATP-utilizing enzyme